MDPQGPPANQPTPTANAPTPVATNPLNGRPIFLNTLALGTPTETPATSTSASTSATAMPTIGPATSPAANKSATGAGKTLSFSLHFAMCTDNCSSAFTLTGIVLALFVGSIIFMFLHYKRRNRDDADEPMVSVDTKFTGGMGRDLKSPFDNTRGFNSFDEYHQRNLNTDSYYEDDYVEGYAGVAGFAPLKENRQSSHAGIGGFGVPKPSEPMPALPMVPPPPVIEPAPYDPEFAEYEDEWERFQQEEAAAAAASVAGGTPRPHQQPAYRGGHDSTVEGAYFAPQAYGQGHAEEDMDEDHAFEPSPYFQANPMQNAEEDEQEHYAVPMPQFEVEDYYMRDHLAADPVAPTANAPNMQITWMNTEQDKSYWDQHNK